MNSTWRRMIFKWIVESWLGGQQRQDENSSIYFFDKYLLTAYCVSDTVLDLGDRSTPAKHIKPLAVGT